MHSESTKLTSRIAIVGVGDVGAAAAYALILGSVAGELLLVEKKVGLRDGQVLDLGDATYRGNSGTRVRTATHREAGQCDIVIITAGAKQRPGETQTQLVDRNTAVIGNAIEQMKPFRPDTILLIVSRPVDVFTYFAQKVSGLPKSQVIGTGTFLDSLRLRGLVAEKTEIAPSSIDAYVLGEQGNSQFVAWSIATIGGVPFDQALLPNSINKAEIADTCKHRTQRISEEKGAAFFGIGSVVSSICASILFDKKNVRPISHFQPSLGCCLSLPAVLGRKGIVRTIPVQLSEEEKKELITSANGLKRAIQAVKRGFFADKEGIEHDDDDEYTDS